MVVKRQLCRNRKKRIRREHERTVSVKCFTNRNIALPDVDAWLEKR